ncbi:MAG: hypothetical protein HOQ06_06630 [Pseudarthrobacter sp.]|nr:hypothetical protein [Pseudarthrobacter sp.]
MARPDPGVPDPGANQDDAVWLDLVARLESDEVATRPDPPLPNRQQPDRQQPADEAAGNTGHRPASFRDFDPLGLAGTPPAGASPAERGAAPSGDGARAAGSSGDEAEQQDAAGPRDYDMDDGDMDDDGGEFVPEEPPSLAGTDPLTMLAWLAAVGGPVALLLSAMFWRSAPLLAIVGIVAVFVLGTVYLIMKLPQEKNEDDDGARV